MSVLAAPAGLADETALDLLDCLADRLAVGDLRPSHVRGDVELALEAVDDDLQVKLAHAGNQRLPGVLVTADPERRVLLGETLKARRELVLVCLRLRLDGHRDDRIGEGDRLELDRSRVRGKRVACGRVLQADARRDLARTDLLALLAVVGVHLEDAPDPLGPAGVGVQHPVAGLELARVDTEVRQLPDVRI